MTMLWLPDLEESDRFAANAAALARFSDVVCSASNPFSRRVSPKVE
jgi:hypothetical protein